MIVESSIEGIRRLTGRWRRAGYSICLVPTMGYFHEGHLALMRKARKLADKTVVSLFVNPAQFGPEEDLAVYPRDFEGDKRKAEEVGVDVLFCPATEEIYGKNHQTAVTVSELSIGLCGNDRPGHFTGVATVVSKLFNIVQPDYAIFGEKDFQQLMILKRMVEDLNFPLEIIGHPIVRESDGLALSSRNAYLSDVERKAALILNHTLVSLKERILAAGSRNGIDAMMDEAGRNIEAEPLCSLEYLSVVREESLEPGFSGEEKCRVLGAIKVSGRIRLIDNLPLY